MEDRVEHQPQANRFVLEVDGRQAVLDYRQQEGRLILTHTGVPVELRQQGLAAELTRAALAYAQEQGLKVVPACSYAADFLRRHPEYAGLLE